MITLDRETADYTAALAVRRALLQGLDCHFASVEATVSALRWAKLLDVNTASYVSTNAERFCVLPFPRLFDAVWHAAAESLQSDASKTASAHPYPTA